MGAGLTSSADGFAKAFKRCAWLLGAGAALQLILGPADPSFLSHPCGLLSSIVFLYLLIVVYVASLSHKWLRELYGPASSAAILTVLLLLLLFFGLVRQDGGADGLWGLLGFTQMQRSWIFILPLVFFTATVVLNAVSDIHHFSISKIGKTLSHIAISTVLISGIFGSGDFVSAKLMAKPGEPVRMAMDLGRLQPAALPFELTLDCFNYEEEGGVARVSSDVSIRVDGEAELQRTRISVNHPAKVGSWRIYQTGYETEKGAESTYSLLSCVYDPWMVPVGIALWVFLLAGTGMVFFGMKRK